jgi:hypothetical protein
MAKTKFAILFCARHTFCADTPYDTAERWLQNIFPITPPKNCYVGRGPRALPKSVFEIYKTFLPPILNGQQNFEERKKFFYMTISNKFKMFFKILFTKCLVFIYYLQSLKKNFLCMISLAVWSGAILFVRATLYAATVHKQLTNGKQNKQQ